MCNSATLRLHPEKATLADCLRAGGEIAVSALSSKKNKTRPDEDHLGHG
jgi:hypothetical protein